MKHGAGLGLSTVKMLAEAHGGRINILTQPDQGTTVNFRIKVRSNYKLANNSGSNLNTLGSSGSVKYLMDDKLK